jgi:hypothetical protein
VIAPSQFPPVASAARIVPFSIALPLLLIPPPEMPALLPEKVLLVTVSVPLFSGWRHREPCAVAGKGAIGDRQRGAAVVEDAAAVACG